MSSTRWNEVENLLQAALDRDPEGRAAFLVQARGGDEDLGRPAGDPRCPGRAAHAPLLSGGPAVAGAPESLNSATISHYRVEHRIGAGGMGEVFRAYDELLRRTVAVKVLPAAFTADAERVRRFEQEALAASRLIHPNIITIFETIHSGGAHFIVTELVDGPTLRALAKEPLGLSSALDIAVQICAALQAAHGARIIHRDIKPENVMVRSDGLVKVLDFGIAKLGEESLASGARGPATDSLTMPGAVLGTARYMSPEQARGEWLDERTRLYSLGVVLREMLAGTPVPKSVQRIIYKALQPRREDRYASATAMLTDL